MHGSRIKGLYAIADSAWNSFATMAELVEKYLEGGCRLIQIRMKGVNRDKVEVVSRDVSKLKAKYDFTFIINDYPDIAVEVGADGVHVGENDIPVSEIKRNYGERLVVGYSSHSIDEAKRAEGEGADYVAFGAIFSTKTKGPGHPVQGIERLRSLVGEVEIPVVAIGGIGRDNISDVIDAGANSVAMITALCSAGDVAQETNHFVHIFEE